MPEEMKDCRKLFPFTDADYDYIHACTEIGGKENTQGLVLWACKNISGADIDVPPLAHLPTEGFYHPSLPDTYDYSAHMQRMDPKKPTAGILIHQFYYVRKNLAAVDALISAIESKGMNALAVFLVTSPDTVTGAIGIRQFIEQYLIRDKKPLIDVLIVNMGFSQISLSDPNDGTKTEPRLQFFLRSQRASPPDDLHVPVVQYVVQ